MNFKYLQKLFFLLVMGFSLTLVCACGDDEEDNKIYIPEDNEENVDSVVITSLAVTGDVGVYGCTYAHISGYVNLELLPAGMDVPEVGVKIYSDNHVETKVCTSLADYSFTVFFDNLSPGKVYKYRTYVAHDDVVYYGDYRTFTTKDVINVAHTDNVSEINYTSAVVTSTAKIADVGLDGNRFTFGVAYSITEATLHPDSSFNHVSASMYDVEEDGNMTYAISLSELSGATTYYYAAYTELDGVYRFSDIKSFTTKGVQSGAVDLGLSVKWASCNVGASSPEEYGGYYAWGETEEKSDYSWKTYKWCNGKNTSMTKYYRLDGKTVLDLEDDVAHVKLGGNWRMPTQEEIDELRDRCTWERCTYKEVAGHLVTGPNGNSIFLPSAGYRLGTNLCECGFYYYFWSATLCEGYSDRAYYLNIYYNADIRSDRYVGRPVRPVTE